MHTQTLNPVKPESTIQQRFRQIIEDVLKKDIGVVAAETGIPKGTLDNIVNGRVASIKDIHLAAIVTTYQNINANFILTGKGEPTISPDAARLTTTLKDIRSQIDKALGD